jgi:hypothetical protein
LKTSLLLGAVLAAATAALAQAPEPSPAGSLPTVQAFADLTGSRVGERFSLTLEVEEPAGWKVDPPAKELDLGSFRVRSMERAPRPDGKAFRLTLVPLEAGDLEIPALTLSAHGPDGREEEIQTEAIPVAVASNLPAPSEQPEGSEVQAADLKPALTAPRNWIPLVVAVLVLALVAALATYLLKKVRARSRPLETPPSERKPLRPAWEIALEELDRILSANYVGRGELKRQYVEVTEALRTYLEDRYGVPALESTTTDLNELLRGAPVPGDMSARILSLLREADLVKFAKASPEPSEARATEARARSLVVATMPPGLATETGP